MNIGDDIFTIKELTDAGFVKVPAPVFVIDKNNIYDDNYCVDSIIGAYPMAVEIRTLKSLWNDSFDSRRKLIAKQKIISELKDMKFVFIHSIGIKVVDFWKQTRKVYVSGCKQKVNL